MPLSRVVQKPRNSPRMHRHCCVLRFPKACKPRRSFLAIRAYFLGDAHRCEKPPPEPQKLAGVTNHLQVDHRGEAIGRWVGYQDVAGHCGQFAVRQCFGEYAPTSLPLSLTSSCINCAIVRPRSALLVGAGSTNRDLKSGPCMVAFIDQPVVQPRLHDDVPWSCEGITDP